MSINKHTLVAPNFQLQHLLPTNLIWCQWKTRTLMFNFKRSFVGFFAVVSLLTLAPAASLALSPVNYVEKKLIATDQTPLHRFGAAVAISGDTAVVAAPYGSPSNEAVYVFVRSGSSWTYQATLKPLNPVARMGFGASVAIDGDTIVVGAEGLTNSQDNTYIPGAVFVFVRSGSQWSEQKRFDQPSTYAKSIGFGASVAISGDTLAFSELYSEVDDPVYIYVRSGSTWSFQQQLNSPTAEAETSRLLFGYSLSLQNNTLVVGTPEEDDEQAKLMNTGSAFVFVRSGSTWTPQAKLTAPESKESEFFGISVSIDGDDLAVGASNVFDKNRTGSVYMFSRSGSVWNKSQTLQASDMTPVNAFGHCVALKGDRLLVGSPATYLKQEPALDSAYVFKRSNSTWSEQLRLFPSDTAIGDSFGFSVAISPDILLVGAPDNNTEGVTFAGAAYIYSEPQGGDTTAPIISGLANINLTAPSTLGATATFNPTATDDVDGSVPVTCSPTSGSIFPVGTTTVQCEAKDSAGNTATGSFTVTVSYAWSGFLQPINQDGSSVFKLGSTIAVKFQLTGDSSGVQNATAKFSYVKISNKVSNGSMKTSTTAAPTSGDTFRFDGTSQYIYNWGTKGLTSGTYQLRIDLGDGVSRTVNVSLK